MKTCKRGLHQYEGRKCLACAKNRRDLPDVKARQKSRDAARQATPEYKAMQKIYMKAYSVTPKNRAYRKAYSAKPETRARRKTLVLLNAGFLPSDIALHLAVVACEACGDRAPRRGLAFDHDHATGRYRGTLCRLCNL